MTGNGKTVVPPNFMPELPEPDLGMVWVYDRERAEKVTAAVGTALWEYELLAGTRNMIRDGVLIQWRYLISEEEEPF